MKLDQLKQPQVQPAERLYQWFSTHDPDASVRYTPWDEMTYEQRSYWIQAANATLGAEVR